MKIVALGRTRWLLDSIRALADHGHQFCLIATSPASPEYGVTEEDFRKLAQTYHCPFFCDSRIERPAYLEMLRAANADVAISVNWPTVLTEQILDLFPHGVINAHFGDLPRFRGNAAPNWAILNGEKQVTVTLHRMAPSLDAGPVFLKRSMELRADTYIADVYEFASRAVPEMFVEVITKLQSGEAKAYEQPTDPKLSLRCFPRHPFDSEIDWNQNADSIVRLVRASAEPFAGAYTYVRLQTGLKKLIVWRARAGKLDYPCLGIPGQVIARDSKSGEVAVLAKEGVVILEEVEIPSMGRGKPFNLITSTRVRLGLQVSLEIESLWSELQALRSNLPSGEQRRDGG